MKELEVCSFFGSEGSIAIEKISEYKYPWQAVPNIGKIIRSIIPSLSSEYEEISEGVFVFSGVEIPKSACIVGPAIICEGAEIRHSAYIRGNVIVGKGAVVGNSTEIKNSILFDYACVPHYNYIGDSIIGYKSHLGAGAIISNLKSDKKNVKLRYQDRIIDTGMRKLGAIIGKEVEVGCGSVLNPGTIIMDSARVYPLSRVRGTIEKNMIYKNEGQIVKQN